ncbi:MAG: hypothetical protein WCV50_04525 [Patescibacteria group bacterium]|jgi:hypothetical protein
MSKKNIIAFSAILFFAFLVLPKISAALEVTPAIREVDLAKGEKTVVMIELQNEATETMQLNTQVVNFTAKDEISGEPEYNLTGTPTGIATWTTVQAGPIVIQPSGKVEVPVTFDTPATATPGGHYVGVVFSFVESAAAATNNSLKIESKVAVPILATVAGNFTESARIVAFKTNKTNYTSGPVKFTLRYENTGAVHLKPTGKVTVTSMFGKVVKEATINTELSAVLPGTIRQYDVASWKDLGSAFGKYTAKVTLTSSGVVTNDTYDFWVFSTTGIVIAVVILLVVMILIVLLIKALTKKKTEAPAAK